jgi:hypothetical protein
MSVSAPASMRRTSINTRLIGYIILIESVLRTRRDFLEEDLVHAVGRVLVRVL